jgi:hypothetical protein
MHIKISQRIKENPIILMNAVEFNCLFTFRGLDLIVVSIKVI